MRGAHADQTNLKTQKCKPDFGLAFVVYSYWIGAPAGYSVIAEMNSLAAEVPMWNVNALPLAIFTYR